MVERVGKITIADDGQGKIVWSGLLNGDTGAPARMARYADKTVMITGTFGVGGAVQIQGSADAGTTWGRLRDPQGTLISVTDIDGVVLAENPEIIRPEVTAGDGTTDLVVTLTFVQK